jgi:hypothetical protein
LVKRRSIYKAVLLCFFIGLSTHDLFAQTEKDSTIISFLDSLFSGENKKTKIIPLPYAGYLPETRFLFGCALLLTTRLSKDSTLPFSYSEFDFTYTQNHQSILENDMFLYIGHHYILKGLVGIESYPDRFWGVGVNAPTDSLERYNSNRIFVDLTFVRRVTSHFYAGLKWRLYDMYHIHHIDGANNITPDKVDGATGSFSNGLGLALIWDTRNNILNSSTGTYLCFYNPRYSKLIGSDYNFSRYEIDFRHFMRLSRKQVLAMQMTGVFETGTPPFNMYALLGSDMDMRGYYKGRYRDRDFMSVQVEYRRHLFWRIGLTAFASVGNVNNTVGNLLSTAPRYSYGGGIRLKMNRKDNINLRLDYAFGTAPNRGLYIYLAEAF